MPDVAEDEDVQSILEFCREQLPDGVRVFVEVGGHFRGDVTIIATDDEHSAGATLPRPEHRSALTVAGTAVELIKNWAGAKAHAKWDLNGGEQP